MSRDALDRYYTPDDLAQALVGLLPIEPGDLVLEPSAGGGAFVRALLGRTQCVLAIDIDERAPVLRSPPAGVVSKRWDFLEVPGLHEPNLDAIVGNPPYAAAQAHVEHALQLVKPGGLVAFLLRLAFLESTSRVDFWEANPCWRVWVLAQRPSFTGGGTDSCAYGWFVWRCGWTGTTELRVLSWR